MPGDVGPPIGNPGQLGASPGAMGQDMQGPEIGPNGQAALTVPGSTLAPNEAQYPVGQGPSGMKCPQISVQMQQFNCTLSFNIPPPSPSPSPGSAGTKATPTPTPTPSPTPTPTASSDDEDDSGPAASPSATPPGTITMQVEALPKDVPPMTNPDRRALSITPLVAIRLQSDSNFNLNGLASVQYVLPRQQLPSRGFWIQLYNEGVVRGKRVDQFLGTYNKYVSNEQIINFNFATPKLTVKRGQIWLLAMYGLTYPPNATPAPSPTPSPAASGSPSSSTFTPGPSPSPT